MRRATDAVAGDARPAGPAGRLAALEGWQRRGMLILGGLLAAAALPPLHLVPLLLPAFLILLAVLEGARSRGAAFAAGWWFGTAFLASGLYWTGLPMVVDIEGDRTRDVILLAGLALPVAVAFLAGRALSRIGAVRHSAVLRPVSWACAWLLGFGTWILVAILFVPAPFAWMIPFAVYGLGGGLALFVGLATLAVSATGARGLALALLLAVGWSVAEWLRGHLFTGFPWNLVATAWTFSDAMMQPAAWVGAYGLGLLTVLAALLAILPLASGTGRRVAFAAPLAAAVLLAGLWAAGSARLPPAPAAAVDGVVVRIVQARIDQTLKWRPDLREANLMQHVDLSRAPGFERVTLVVWPEASIDYRLQSRFPAARLDQPRAEALLSAIPRDGLLVLGAVRDDETGSFNSVHAVDSQGRIVATYDKHHLVPFGEYVPFRRVLRTLGVEAIAQQHGDFGAGPGPRTVALPGLPPVSPLICYEAIFPSAATVPVGDGARPGWLLNVTNDGWFGMSAGPYQHFASARLRSVEEGLPMVRAANTGISAIVDPYGRVVARLGLGRRGALDGLLPQATKKPPFYAIWGDMPLAGLLLVVASGGLAISWVAGRRQRAKACAPTEF